MADRRRRHDQQVNFYFPVRTNLFGNLKIKIDEGEWRAVENFLDSLPRVMKKSYDNTVEAFGREILRRVKNSLRTGKPPRGVRWEPWSDSYLYKHPNLMLNRTGRYERAVGIYKRGMKTYVGLPTSGTQRSSSGGITLNALAIIHEYGGGEGGGALGGHKIPARPLWNPIYQRVLKDGKLQKTLLSNLKDAVTRSIRNTYSFRGKGSKTFKLNW